MEFITQDIFKYILNFDLVTNTYKYDLYVNSISQGEMIITFNGKTLDDINNQYKAFVQTINTSK